MSLEPNHVELIQIPDMHFIGIGNNQVFNAPIVRVLHYNMTEQRWFIFGITISRLPSNTSQKAVLVIRGLGVQVLGIPERKMATKNHIAEEKMYS